MNLGSNAVMEAFGADLERARGVDVAHHSESRGRVVLPSIEFVGPDRVRHGVYGPSSVDAYRDAALAAGATPVSAQPLSVPDALRRFGTMATAEVSLVCGLPGPRAPAELWRLVCEWQVSVERTPGGELWALV